MSWGRMVEMRYSSTHT